MRPRSPARRLPILDRGCRYDRRALASGLLAAAMVAIMLAPQSPDYAMLAGLPPETGIYASVAPILLYAILGTSRALAAGPVAAVSSTTAAAVTEQGTAGYVAAAPTLAFLSGAFLVLVGVFRMGFLANFLSRPVIAGFIAASGLLIATSQFKHILGIPAGGDTLSEMVASPVEHLGETNLWMLGIGAAATAVSVLVRTALESALMRFGISASAAGVAIKAGPFAAVVATTLLAWGLGLASQGVKIVGEAPQGLSPLDLELVTTFAAPALLISVNGFMGSVSVAQTLAAKRSQRIEPDQELNGLGAANIRAAFTRGIPVTGGFARFVVNSDAGAETPAAGAFPAFGLLVAALALTPLLDFLPQATLAATIIVVALSLVDLSILRRAWACSKGDFSAVAVLLSLGLGVVAGVTAGASLSLALNLHKASRPHVAKVGCVPGAQQFRNFHRRAVETDLAVLQVRTGESLALFNARVPEERILSRIAGSPVRLGALTASDVTEVDFTGLKTLEERTHRLKDAGITLRLSEVEEPVLDRLERTTVLKNPRGGALLSHHDAMPALSGAAPTKAAAE